MDESGAVVAQRVIHLPPKYKVSDDIAIAFDVANAIKLAVRQWDIRLVSIELPAFSAASNRSKQLNILFGSILTILALPYVGVNATSLKKFATGSGRHSKEEKKTVMLEAWESTDPISYATAKQYFLSQPFTKSMGTRAMGDLADSFWLARYGLDVVGKCPDNPLLHIETINDYDN